MNDNLTNEQKLIIQNLIENLKIKAYQIITHTLY